LSATYVRVQELKLGSVVAENIFANTQTPIIYKNSKITHEHLHIFKVFNISSVLVYTENNLKLNLTLNEGIEDLTTFVSSTSPSASYNTFDKLYTDAVTAYKKEFSNWTAGAKVDIAKIRLLILPLIEKVLENRSYIFDLNSYSIPKDYLYHHCIATGLISAVLAQKLGFDRGNCIQMALAGTLADCGMSKVSPKIREKKEALTAIEFAEIRKHPIHSYSMIKDFPVLKKEMKEAVFKHHERLDGSGYPTGKKIPSTLDYSQIIALADVYHAMTSERLYRIKQSPFIVIEMIKESEFGKFDIKVVQALMDLIVELPIGTKVELSNLERGEVMFINKFVPTRPLIKLESTGEIIDLSTNRYFHITRVLMKDYLY
jgi:HD-GYP domain-containing protein (c-di-GMP phosphodiesterase class II)